MTTAFKPLLADTCEDITKLRFPVLVSPKLDGIRCVKLNGKALTRKLKPIPNDYIREWVENNLPDGIDGELMLRDHRAPFSAVSSAVMSRGEVGGMVPDFVFCAFDLLLDRNHVSDPDDTTTWTNRAHELPFEVRYDNLVKWIGPGAHHLALVPHVQADTPEELQEIVDAHVDLGYEGSMVRSLNGRYKFGRSTVKEGILLKIKSFVDEEARVIGMVEQMHNENEAKKDNLGNTKRSSAKAGKVPTGKLGALQCRLEDGTEFEIGTGFTDVQRIELWDRAYDDRDINRLVKFKHQPPPGGRKPGEAPRFPVFLGWRED